MFAPFRINAPEKEEDRAAGTALDPLATRPAGASSGGGGGAREGPFSARANRDAGAQSPWAPHGPSYGPATGGPATPPFPSVSRPSATAKFAARRRPPAPGDPYLSRLIKLVPSEVVALYLTFKEVAVSWLGIWATICLVLVVVVRTLGTRQAGKPVQVGAILIATVSFILWVYATGGHFLHIRPPANVPGLISVSVGVWTFLLPYLYKGD
jgi:hypothetical protein